MAPPPAMSAPVDALTSSTTWVPLLLATTQRPTADTDTALGPTVKAKGDEAVALDTEEADGEGG